MPVIAVALMWRTQSVMFGAIAGAIILLSLLGHEVAHLLVARRATCLPSTIVLWPLGGMYNRQGRLMFREAMIMSLAGPVVNFGIAFGCGWELHRLGMLSSLLNPFGFFEFDVNDNLAHSCLRIGFVVNYCLGLFNLIPVRPLDAGQALSAFLNLRFAENETRDLMMRIGLVVSLFGVLAGFVFDVSSLVALSTFLLVMHLHDASHWNAVPPQSDDTFMGYDFSEGYTSLDREDDLLKDEDSDDPGSGILERWKARREEERVIRESEDRELEEVQLDRILEKLHIHGREALTAREVNILNRVSARLRQRHVQE